MLPAPAYYNGSFLEDTILPTPILFFPVPVGNFLDIYSNWIPYIHASFLELPHIILVSLLLL
jgi:hypothetical protein